MMETGTEAMLTERIRDMGSDEAVKLVSELCAQLENSGQAVHGNIWPGNVTVNEDGTAVLGEGSDATVSERKAVQVEFLAPEYFWDNSAGGAGDVYSLGLLLYAGCNGGYLPFQPKGGALTDRDRSGALRKRMKGEPVTLPAGTDPRLGAVILKALSYEPEERYQSPGELLAALNASEEELPGEDLAEAAVAAGAVPAAAFDTEETVDLSHLDPETAPAADLPEEPNSPEETPTWTGKPAPVETAREVPPAEPEKKYTVQKDFDGGRKSGKNSGRKTSRGTTAAPATRKKKKASPAIPILCVAAVAVIGGAAWVGFNHGGELLDRIGLTRQPAPTPEISEPYVILNTESTPEPTEEIGRAHV